MSEPGIRFNDGAAYERMMGAWSRIAGGAFLDWLAPSEGMRWVDVGCGNGAFTELVVERCAPASVDGIDPSEAQIAYARTRKGASIARFRQGDAMDLPYDDDAFDVAAMALVLAFVPDPAKGVAEMRRVVVPGGQVAAYMWDMRGAGFPLTVLHAEMRELGVSPPLPPSNEASGRDAMQALWTGAGLVDVAGTTIIAERRFDDFEDWWTTSLKPATTGAAIASMAPGEVERLRSRMQ
ncbi:MAG: class I SAM-dependent methyltransferase, partial [Vicinamibacteria bacterium]